MGKARNIADSNLSNLTVDTTTLVIDATNNRVGIGTASPSINLHVKATTPVIGAEASTWTTGASGELRLAYVATDARAIKGHYDNGMTFHVNGERMRIDSSGNLLVGTTATISAGKQTLSYNGVSNNGITISESANTSGTSYLVFNQGSTVIGSVSRVGATSAVVYNTTSDQRLKSNIADANPVLDKLMSVKVRQFDWTEGDLHQEAGFIAQELAPVLSGIVTEGKTEKDVWQVDYSRLTPYLVKAIQEQQTLIENLTTRLNALEGK